VPIVDLMTGMYAAVAILAALARRTETGQGDTVDLAMLDVQAAFLANQAMNWLVGGQTPRRGGNRHPNIQPQDVFPCADGQIVLAVGNDGQFAELCEAIGRPDWAQDERFTTNAARVRSSAALDVAGVPCGPINAVPQVFEDPRIVHRRMLRSLPHPAAGAVPQVVSPMNFAEAPLAFDRAPPLLGQHTAEVLGEIGLGRAEIEALAARGVV
jgi:crotonobetainyl-CoA:carnitine CoA-transferase CaiB-like acyl-CoA transferase